MVKDLGLQIFFIKKLKLKVYGFRIYRFDLGFKVRVRTQGQSLGFRVEFQSFGYLGFMLQRFTIYGFKVQGLGILVFEDQGFGDLEFMVQCLGFLGLEFQSLGYLGFSIQGFKIQGPVSQYTSFNLIFLFPLHYSVFCSPFYFMSPLAHLPEQQ